MTESDIRFEIPETMKLEGPSNYIIWAFKFQNVCEGRDLWEVVENPAVPLICASTVDKDITAAKNENARLKKLQAKAKVAFQMSVCDHLLIHIVRETCPHAMFLFFKNMFADASEDRRQLLRMKLANLCMKDEQTVEIFMRSINETLYELANCGDKLTDKELIHTILISLPSSWASFRTSVKVSGGQTLTFAKLQNLLVDEQMSREVTRIKDGVTEHAMAILQTPGQPNTPFQQFPPRNAFNGNSRGRADNIDSKKRHYSRESYNTYKLHWIKAALRHQEHSLLG